MAFQEEEEPEEHAPHNDGGAAEREVQGDAKAQNYLKESLINIIKGLQ